MVHNVMKHYQAVERAVLSGRETEARVLTQAALKLLDCQKNWDSSDRKQKLDEALQYNQKIWSIFQAELSKPENPLPYDIKINLLNLSRFIDKRIIETMISPQPDKLTIIVKINQNIAAGLRGSTSGPIDD